MSSKFLIIPALSAFSWLPWFGKDTPNPPEEPTPATEEIVAIEETAPTPIVEPPAPLLFADPLPLHSELSVSGLGMVYSSSCGGCHGSPQCHVPVTIGCKRRRKESYH